MPNNRPGKRSKLRTKLYLTSGQLRERYGGRSKMWIERIMQRDPAFPRPIYIGRFRLWDEEKMENYERDVAARRVPDALLEEVDAP